MNLSGLTSGITRNMDKIGLLAGVAGNRYGINGITNAISSAATGNIHIPDLASLANDFTTWQGFKSGIMALIGGYVVEEFAPSGFKKWGKMVSDFGLGYLEGALGATVVVWMTNANQGSDPSKANFNPNWYQNITQAPTTQQAIAQYNY